MSDISVSSIKNIFNRPKPEYKGPQHGPLPDVSGLKSDMDNTYSIEPQNWYSAKPYGFKMKTRNGNTFTMFLPISPSNLNISTAFATNVIPTLYGTVEEHSDVRYYDITIEGTTSIAPKFVEPGAGESTSILYSQLQTNGRTTTPLAFSISAGGFFAKTLAAANQIANKATDLINGAPKAKSGIKLEESGYVAFHNLYRFLLQYKKDASGVSSSEQRNTHPLTFFNYKDNNQYDVAVRRFDLRRSSSDPMLYFYTIQLRGYNLTSIKATISDDLNKRLSDLGLDGVDGSSILGDIKSISGQAKSIIGSLAGGINILGR